jgi:hypothetical protein
LGLGTRAFWIVFNIIRLHMSTNSTATERLGDLAAVRSGDKGNHANLGVVALRAGDYAHLVRHLTGERVCDFFRAWGVERVERFELPNIRALNFVLYNALGGGASRSLRVDTQGKLFGTAALEILLPAREAARGDATDAGREPEK